MNYLVIYPGRFHIFHLGHKAVYDHLVKKYGDNVYIATSNVQAPGTSPFSYSDKVAMLTKMGVPSSHILQVANPYATTEYTQSSADPENTVLIFAVGAKDQKLVKDANGKVIQRPRFTFAPKKDGSPSAIQPLPNNLKKCQPMSTGVAYADVVDTQEFKVLGKSADSASTVRKLYIEGNDADRTQIITDLYGAPYPELKDIFDQKLGVNKPQDAVIYGQERVFAGDNPVNIMKENRLLKLRENILRMRKQLKVLREQTSIAEGEVVPFPGKAIPPDLEQARKLAYQLIDAAYNGKGDPSQQTADIRQQLQRMGYRVRGAGRGFELVNDQYTFKQLIQPFDYLEEKKH